MTNAVNGAGSRYNDGKPHLELIPLTILANSFKYVPTTENNPGYSIMHNLGKFQESGNISWLDTILKDLNNNWIDCANVFHYGSEKYSKWNWAQGMAWSIPLACAARHCLKLLNGQMKDDESGLPHIGHIMCNIVMLRTFVDTYPAGNDLPIGHFKSSVDDVIQFKHY